MPATAKVSRNSAFLKEFEYFDHTPWPASSLASAWRLDLDEQAIEHYGV
jgi:hypothetical protein